MLVNDAVREMRLKTKDGKYTNAIYGFLSILFKFDPKEKQQGLFLLEGFLLKIESSFVIFLIALQGLPYARYPSGMS